MKSDGFFRKSETTTWNGREVKFRPGKLYVCTKLGVEQDYGSYLVKSFAPNCTIRSFFQPGIFEIYVESALTLSIATDMMNSGEFRFVELEREGYF
jgi:hypothetical protein